MQLRRIALTFVALPMLAATSALAQSAYNTLTGTVADAQGRPLQGAEITLDPGNGTTTSNAQGLFTLTGLPNSSYTLTVKYAGFDPLTKPLTLTAGQSAHIDLVMTVASVATNVEVYAGREGGEVEAINRMLSADNILNVLPADVITSLPNANVADAIGRLPSVTLERDEGEGKYVKVRGTEPRLTHSTLDGVTIASPETNRQIKLDIIPADLVESVQINKTLQANMEGDGIGGSVDLRTKSAEDHPTIYLEGIGGDTLILQNRGVFQLDGTLGKRFLANKKLGIIFGGSYDWNGRGINDIEPGPALAGTYDLRDYEYFRDRRGFGGTLDYRFSDTSSIYLKGLYALFKNFGDDWIYTPTINGWADSTTLYQGDSSGSVGFSALRRRPVQDIGGLQFGGHHVLRRAIVTWDLDSSYASTTDQGYGSASFAPVDPNNPLNNVQYSLNVENPLEPHLNVQNGVNIFDPTKYFYQGQRLQFTYYPELDLGFGGSVGLPYSIGTHSSTLEVGGRFRNEHKFENQNTQNFATNAGGEDPTLAMTNFLNDFSDPNYYSGAYKFGPAVDYHKVLIFGAQHLKSQIIGNSFNQLEMVSAGYAMNTTNFGRFRLVLGLRAENTSENNLGYVGAKNANGTSSTPVRATGSYLDLLPSASLQFNLNQASNVRLVYSRGLSRPNFSDLIPFRSVSSSGSARTKVSQGNPNLKAEYADDVDVLYERSLPHTGILQAGFFYKNLANPIVSTLGLHAADPTLTGNTNPYFLSQTINAGSAWVYGFEIFYQQHFTSLPGALNGLGASANYGYTASQAHLPAYIDPSQLQPGQISGPNRGPEGANPALVGQAPNSYNFSPTYDKRNLSMRLGMTYNQANIAQYQYTTSNNGPITQGGGGGGPRGPNGDNYFYSHLQVDIQGSYKLRKGFTFVAYGLNLNNEVFGFYNGSSIYPVQREFYKQTFGGGIRWSPSSEK